MTILCIATYFKGDPFLRECKAQGFTVILLTNDKLIGAEWPRESIDEIHSVPRDASDAVIRRHVDKIARRHRIERIAALDDFDVELAAMLREHLRVPGMGRRRAASATSSACGCRRTLGIPECRFAAFNEEVAEWTARVTPPRVLKPRSWERRAAGPRSSAPRIPRPDPARAAGAVPMSGAASSASGGHHAGRSIRSSGADRSSSPSPSSTAVHRWKSRTRAGCSSRAVCRTTRTRRARSWR
jgi:hypothetical protein